MTAANAQMTTTGEDSAAASHGTVVILLASFQGAEFIQAQLDSIAAQSHRDWQLIVSDDGSRDGTRDIVSRFAAGFSEGKISLIDGPQSGATQNFLHLVQQAPANRTLAFCDQDDVWFPDKLARAMAHLARIAGAGHYAARTVITDDDLRPVARSRQFRRKFGFRNALVQACMAGNTSVFNPAAANLLKQGAAAARRAGVESHDWWAYQLTSGAGATLIHDEVPALFYRQHRHSTMGRNDTPRAMAARLAQLFAGAYGGWLSANLQALGAVGNLLTGENRRLVADVDAALPLPGPQAARALRRLGLYRHTRAGTAALYAAAAVGRLRQPRSPST